MKKIELTLPTFFGILVSVVGAGIAGKFLGGVYQYIAGVFISGVLVVLVTIVGILTLQMVAEYYDEYYAKKESK